MICYDCIYYKLKGIMLQNGDEYYESMCDKDKNKDIQNVYIEECEHFKEDMEDEADWWEHLDDIEKEEYIRLIYGDEDE